MIIRPPQITIDDLNCFFKLVYLGLHSFPALSQPAHLPGWTRFNLSDHNFTPLHPSTPPIPPTSSPFPCLLEYEVLRIAVKPYRSCFWKHFASIFRIFLSLFDYMASVLSLHPRFYFTDLKDAPLSSHSLEPTPCKPSRVLTSQWG